MTGSSSRRAIAALAAVTLTGLLAGCGQGYPEDLQYNLRSDPVVIDRPTLEPPNATPPGQLEESLLRIGKEPAQGGVGGKALDPTKVNADQRREMRTALEDMFGTPAAPTVNTGNGAYLAQLELDDATLAEGSRLYRRHCLHCHGLTGDGRGPTGPWVSPHPRDYRQGVFKFISTNIDPRAVADRKPRRADLYRTLEKGVEGTSMPAFGLQSPAELEQLVSYVIHLSIRGEVEVQLIKELLGGRGLAENETIADVAQRLGAKTLENWAKSSQAAPLELPPNPYKDSDAALQKSIARGYQTFVDPKGAGSCISCHKDFGRQVNFRYDDWGTLVRPANLTGGNFRGGRRPADVYYRVAGGIPPSGMPAVTLTKKVKDKDGEREVPDPEKWWDLINFVEALPYPAMLPPEVRAKVYGPSDSPRAHPKE